MDKREKDKALLDFTVSAIIEAMSYDRRDNPKKDYLKARARELSDLTSYAKPDFKSAFRIMDNIYDAYSSLTHNDYGMDTLIYRAALGDARDQLRELSEND